MDVIVVGAGKAGSLHYRAYSRLARAGRLDPARIQFVDHAGRAGRELAALLAADALPERVVQSRAQVAGTPPESTIVDLCLPSRDLAPALVEWWRAGYRKFVVEKPFLVPPDLAGEVGRVLASSSAVLVRNYLHSRVHRTVRELVARYDLAPLLCVTNFSKDRRADSRRRRGASGSGSPTVFEVEIPHQLYIGADLIGEVRSLDHVDETALAGDDGERLRLGEGVLLGRAASGASFIHYSNLRHPTIVRSLDLFCRDQLSVHATYTPICEEFADIKAGVILSRGDTVLAKHLFTEDDNMLAMISHAFETLSGTTGGRVDLEDVLRDNAVIASAVEGTPFRLRAPATARTDALQQWVVSSFRMGLEAGIGRSFLEHLEHCRRERLTEVLPALAPSAARLPAQAETGAVREGALV
ncbi:hypothetical protein ABZ484_19375 [Streptomyces sp. NPDC006393]|uniref:hypothetical protein n=1 Tax=Streptomyces sp. NPDC006393 TaxID=3156763 RepID=UPI003402F364